MLILSEQQVKYCQLLSQVGEEQQTIPGISFQGNLYVKIHFYEIEELPKAIQQCRLNLDDTPPILSLIVQNENGYSLWQQDRTVKLLISAIDNKKNLNAFDIQELANKMRSENGVEIKTRRYKLFIYPRCFIASEAVDWLRKYFQVSREKAVELAKKMMDAQLIHHVADKTNFEDGYFFYRFAEDDVKNIWTEKIF